MSETPYVFCLSESSEDLGQWRSYAPIPNGVCIGFETNNLPFSVFKVEYSVEKQQKKIESFLRYFCDKIISTSKEELDANNNKLMLQLMSECNYYLNFFSATFKNSCFIAENEWRAIILKPKIMFTNENCLKFRSKAGNLIRYIEHGLKKENECGPISIVKYPHGNAMKIKWNRL